MTTTTIAVAETETIGALRTAIELGAQGFYTYEEAAECLSDGTLMGVLQYEVCDVTPGAKTARTKMQEVLEDGIPQGDPCSDIVGLMTNRRMNMTPGWRPSSAASAEVAAHERLGCERYREIYEEGKCGR